MYKKLMVIAICFIAAVALVTVGGRLLTEHAQVSAARKVGDPFVNEALAGKYAESYKLFSSQGTDGLELSTWQDKVAQLSLFFTARKPAFSGASSTGKNSKTLTYKITGNDGNYIFTVVMSNNNKVWQVDSFTSALQT